MKKITSIFLTAMMLVAFPTVSSALVDDENKISNSRPGQNL